VRRKKRKFEKDRKKSEREKRGKRKMVVGYTNTIYQINIHQYNLSNQRQERDGNT